MRNYFIYVVVAFAAMFISSCSNDELEPTTTAFGRGTAQAMIGGVKQRVNWVQLWQGGPKFAEFNVGATAINEYGGLYAWGGLYNQGDDYYPDCGSLPSNRDVATQKWGPNWRMPTKDELKDLRDNCMEAYTTSYQGTGIPSLVFTGKGDFSENSIFLPAAGCYHHGHFEGVRQDVCYWASDSECKGYGGVLLFRIPTTAVNLNFSEEIEISHHNSYSCYSVRAVLK